MTRSLRSHCRGNQSINPSIILLIHSNPSKQPTCDDDVDPVIKRFLLESSVDEHLTAADNTFQSALLRSDPFQTQQAEFDSCHDDKLIS